MKEFVGYMALVLCVAALGAERPIGFKNAFIMSMLLTPIGGLILVLLVKE